MIIIRRCVEHAKKKTPTQSTGCNGASSYYNSSLDYRMDSFLDRIKEDAITKRTLPC